ncbi:MAG: Brp/Blh family beta-carotene 15,15'-dioxygenase [Methylophilaceae bacterium]|nr:Brp/Blh family beta-carotene 15,15'-dioxygenase [Methylophilaceae bacterium]
MPQKKLIKIQSIIFCGIAYAASLMSLLMTNFDEKFSLITLVAFIVTLGVPHGSLDTLFAKELFNLDHLKKWSKFVVSYSIIASIVITLWLLLPTLFLIFFLVISIIHFSDDLVAGTPNSTRILYGGIIIFLPALLHSNELTLLYGYLISIEHATWIVNACHFIAFPWLLGLLLVTYQLKRFNITTILEISAVAMLAILITPLLAFTIYFCTMHSSRHLIRSMSYLKYNSKKIIIGSLVVPTVVVIIGLGAWMNIIPFSMDEAIIKIIFVTLAALTVPHMMLLERSGFSNWIKVNGVNR